jgi:hypothetical protein
MRRHLRSSLSFLVLVIAPWSCVNPAEECTSHCLDHRVEPSAIQDERIPFGAYDTPCSNYHGGGMDAPIPVSAYIGRHCIFPQGYFDNVMAAIDAKNAAGLMFLTEEEIGDYGHCVEGLVDSLIVSCKDHLTCNEAYCDILVGPRDPPGLQACTLTSALALCDTYVRTVAEAALDLDTGPDVPGYAGTDKYLIIDPEEDECDYVPFGTDGEDPTAEGEDGTGTTAGEGTT